MKTPLRKCAVCGRTFKPFSHRQKYCVDGGCALTAKNRRRKQLYHEDLLNLTAFRRNLFKNYTEAANSDPDPARREARVKYLIQFFEYDEKGPRLGLQRNSVFKG